MKILPAIKTAIVPIATKAKEKVIQCDSAIEAKCPTVYPFFKDNCTVLVDLAYLPKTPTGITIVAIKNSIIPVADKVFPQFQDWRQEQAKKLEEKGIHPFFLRLGQVLFTLIL